MQDPKAKENADGSPAGGRAGSLWISPLTILCEPRALTSGRHAMDPPGAPTSPISILATRAAPVGVQGLSTELCGEPLGHASIFTMAFFVVPTDARNPPGTNVAKASLGLGASAAAARRLIKTVAPMAASEDPRNRRRLRASARSPVGVISSG